jgi:hypothetical protein
VRKKVFYWHLAVAGKYKILSTVKGIFVYKGFGDESTFGDTTSLCENSLAAQLVAVQW